MYRLLSHDANTHRLKTNCSGFTYRDIMESQLSDADVVANQSSSNVTPSSHAVPPSRTDIPDAERASISELVRSLRRGSLVRQIASDILVGKPVVSTEPLLDALRGHGISRWKERAVAAWAIGLAARTEDKAAVVSALCDALDCRRARGLAQIALRWGWRLWLYGSLAITVGLLCFDVIFYFTGFAPGDSWYLTTGLCLTLYIAGITLPSVIRGRRLNTLQEFAAKSLGRIPSSSSIPALYRASLQLTGDVDGILNSLGIVLSSVTSKEYGCLNSDVMPVLCKMLNAPSLPLAVLNVFWKIGDGQAVRAVETAAKYGGTLKIQNAAAELLPILIKRREEENAPGILLRASREASERVGELLRPTTNNPSASTDDLLRIAPIMDDRA